MTKLTVTNPIRLFSALKWNHSESTAFLTRTTDYSVILEDNSRGRDKFNFSAEKDWSLCREWTSQAKDV